METVNFSTSSQSYNQLFSPIVSVANKSIIGYEALCDSIPLVPDDIIHSFSILGHKNKLLFINLDLSCIDKGPKGLSEALLTLPLFSESAEKYGIKKENIVIEIVDSKIKNSDALSEIIDVYRRHGFIIALDDFGIGYSNMDRIALLKPNIVKLDSSLIKDIHHCLHKQEIIKSITGLSRKIGAVVVAKGIENRLEALKSLELRTDFLQGEFFQYDLIDSINPLEYKIKNLHTDFKCQIMLNLEIRQNRITFLQNKMQLFKSILNSASDCEEALFKIVYSNSFVESAYILDINGKQVSSTVISPFAKHGQNMTLFSPALKHSDHSLKIYYYKIKTGESEFHISDPYISNATGNRCMTISSITEGNLILCIDVSEDNVEQQFNLNAG